MPEKPLAQDAKEYITKTVIAVALAFLIFCAVIGASAIIQAVVGPSPRNHPRAVHKTPQTP